MSTLVDTFEEALAAHDVTWERTTSGEFEDALAAAIEEPAVGAPLPFDDLSVPDAVTLHPTPAELREAETGVTAAGLGIAEYGTVVVQSRPGGDEPISLYPPTHVAVLRERDLVAGMPEAIDRLGEAFAAGRDTAVLTTGPSATGDMGAIVQGVHGPLNVHVVVVGER